MDNWPCSANIKLLNEEMVEEVNAMEVFDLMEINCAMVEKDMITITNLEIKRVLDKKGVKRAISGPLKGPNVQGLNELPPVCIPHICHFFHTGRIFENQILPPQKTT